jgi:hypothetical protein
MGSARPLATLELPLQRGTPASSTCRALGASSLASGATMAMSTVRAAAVAEGRAPGLQRVGLAQVRGKVLPGATVVKGVGEEKKRSGGGTVSCRQLLVRAPPAPPPMRRQ